MSETILLSYPAAGIAEVRLNRPAQMNALLPTTFTALAAIGRDLAADPSLRAVVLCGEGRAFCAGLDRSCFDQMENPATADADAIVAGRLIARTHGIANRFQQAALAWRDLPVPVIAAIQGVAFGGGLQIAIGADIRLARPDAKFSVMEINWGLLPDMAGMLLMRELVRADILRELCFSGRTFDGTEAQAIGIATRLCDDPLGDAHRLAGELADKSPAAMRALKRLVNLAASAPADAILLAESREQDALIGSPEQMEAVRARLARRPPNFAPDFVHVTAMQDHA